MAPPTTNEDLLDLKMMPAWANEPARPNNYADFEGEDAETDRRRPDRPRNRDRDRERRGPRRPDRQDGRGPKRDDRGRGPRPEGARHDRGPQRERRIEAPVEPLAVDIRFLPHTRAF